MRDMSETREGGGHLAAASTILVWGTTFIATKILLKTFTPIEILMIRFTIGYLGLHLLGLIVDGKPTRKPVVFKEELTFATAALGGITAYYLLENIALSHSSASNVGIIVSVAPLTTALVSLAFPKGERANVRLAFGFVSATVGTYLVISNGVTALELSPFGDLLALAATVGWAFYSIMLKNIDHARHTVIAYTRKIFFYGVIFTSPAMFAMGFEVTAADFTPTTTALLAFLGLGASATCFVSWNFAVKRLGVLKANAYIYLTPLVTLAFSALVLDERITMVGAIGCACILAGLWMSEHHGPSH
jgi:drug/metabolite transporter (DMT)-like permease